MTSTKSEFVTKMETQLKIWDAAVDALAAKGEKVSADTRKAYYAGIKDLRSSREVAQKTLAADRGHGTEDLLWALLNSPEFLVSR